jgi:hypothetical protein
MNGKLEEIRAAIQKGESGQPLSNTERVLLQAFVDMFPDIEGFPDSQVILPENSRGKSGELVTAAHVRSAARLIRKAAMHNGDRCFHSKGGGGKGEYSSPLF